MVWAFARDSDNVVWKYFAHIDVEKGIPVRAMLVSAAFCALYGLLYFASSTAFNSIVTSATIYLNLTYVIPQTILLFRGRSLLPTRVLSLGPLGWFCNAFSLFAVSAVSILLCFPPIIPVEVSSMNYTSVVIFGLAAIVMILWFTTGKSFRGPDVDVEAIEALAAAGLVGRGRKFSGVEWRAPKED
ncbi:hypothetical protein BFJ69_g14047 [Fusarium oxysporum]|uniref:Choline transport protein n=1 Tax=Fusarium oxysporum TaxID=5507 RepID=A0A420MJ14_FUSOX|nr:hypothetical protein BFJ69_g14047 [Fusarium oxysporum]